MTKCATVDVACPRCGAVDQAQAYTRIDVAESPDVLAQLADGVLFDHLCKECGHVATLNYDCCLFDEEAGTVVQYLSNEDDFLDAKLAYGEALAEGLVVRITMSREAFAEKAALLRDKLDDRAMEIMKFAVFNSLVGEHKVDGVAHPVYKGRNEDDEIGIKFVGGAEPTETYVGPMMYDQIMAQVPDEQPFVVDANWASEALRKMD